MVRLNLSTLISFSQHSLQGPSAEQFAEQLTLIDSLAPYFRHLKACDLDMFFERLFDLWFIRWRLKLQDYGGKIDPLESRHAVPDGGTTFLLYTCSIWLTSLSAVDRGGAHSSIFICARRAHAIFLDDLHDNLQSPARGLSQGTVLAYSMSSNLGANNAARGNSAITMKTVTSAPANPTQAQAQEDRSCFRGCLNLSTYLACHL